VVSVVRLDRLDRAARLVSRDTPVSEERPVSLVTPDLWEISERQESEDLRARPDTPDFEDRPVRRGPLEVVEFGDRRGPRGDLGVADRREVRVCLDELDRPVCRECPALPERTVQADVREIPERWDWREWWAVVE
jgi:hypothetical protein